MSGKRQHFIPRFIQEGFASHRNSGQTYTWVYRKGAVPFNSNIINVGVEGQFYSQEDKTADDVITAAESGFSELINKLRSGNSASLSDPSLPTLIAHLEVRTRHIRENFLQTGEYLVLKLTEFMSDETRLEEYLHKKLKNDPTVFRKPLEEELKKQRIPKHLHHLVMQHGMALVPSFIRSQKATFAASIRELGAVLPEVLKKAAKSGHIKALSETIASEPRVRRYDNLSFAMVDSPCGLPLGDSVVFFQVEGPRRYKAFLEKDDGLVAVFLPLDSKTILVGTRKGERYAPAAMADIVARCSLEYFIANENSANYASVHKQIGVDAALLSQAELEELFNEVIAEK